MKHLLYPYLLVIKFFDFWHYFWLSKNFTVFKFWKGNYNLLKKNNARRQLDTLIITLLIQRSSLFQSQYLEIRIIYMIQSRINLACHLHAQIHKNETEWRGFYPCHILLQDSEMTGFTEKLELKRDRRSV